MMKKGYIDATSDPIPIEKIEGEGERKAGYPFSVKS
jgi:hypothetical protein